MSSSTAQPRTVSTIEVDAFLCDSVEGVGQKLYAIGIAWNTILAPQFPARHSRIGVGMIIRVPYTATNQVHTFRVSIVNEDGGKVSLGDAVPGIPEPFLEDDRFVNIESSFNVGRPPDLQPGDEQVVPLAVQLDQIEFPAQGLYAVTVHVDDTEMAHLPFRLKQVQQVMVG
jgi:hypothetical protein